MNCSYPQTVSVIAAKDSKVPWPGLNWDLQSLT